MEKIFQKTSGAIAFAVFCLFSLSSCAERLEPPITDPTPFPKHEPGPTVINVTEVKLNASALNMTVGDSCALVATVYPENASVKTVFWKSDNTDIATVNEGIVTAVAYGTTVISAISEDGGKTDSCTVTVNDIEDERIEILPSKEDNPAIYADGGSVEISFTSEEDWTAETFSDGNWLTIDKTSGTGGVNSVILTTSQNSGDDRTGVVSIRTSAGTKRIEFTQRANIFTITPQKQRNVRIIETVTYAENTFNEMIVLLPYPQSSIYQTISNLSYGNARVLQEDKGYDKALCYVFKQPFPDSPLTFNVDFSVTSNKIDTDFKKITSYVEYDKSSPVYLNYTCEERDYDGNIQIDPGNGRIQGVANELWENNGEDIIGFAKSAYKWVADNIPYTGGRPGDITDILENGGDCGNQASVYISLLRAKGIPARHVVMRRTDGSCHVRAEFFLAGYGWIPVDPDAYQGDRYHSYFGKVDYDCDAIVMNQGLCEWFDIPDMGWTKIGLLQIHCWWLWWWKETEVDIASELIEI